MATILPDHNHTPSRSVERTRRRGTTVRGRGSGRGRGRRGRVRGGTRGTFQNGRDPTRGWRISNIATERLLLEDVFVNEVIEERARLFCSSDMERLIVERAARRLPSSRAEYVVLIMDELLLTYHIWLNGHISLHRIETTLTRLDDMYQFLSVFLPLHCTGFSFMKTKQLMRKEGCNTPTLD